MSALAYAVSLVKRWESCRLEAYPDPATGGAPWTIGWGATGPGIVKGVKWTQAQADERLAQDVTRFLKGVQSAVKKPATDAQTGAMTSLAYNIGAKAFASSTLLRKFNAGDVAG
ncbi:lysozyme, partial [Streptomyces wuyuanensis]|uniref:lysozyme n=3 Tax=Bacteria TaxID=2 RepID=UPI0034150DFF